MEYDGALAKDTSFAVMGGKEVLLLVHSLLVLNFKLHSANYSVLDYAVVDCSKQRSNPTHRKQKFLYSRPRLPPSCHDCCGMWTSSYVKRSIHYGRQLIQKLLKTSEQIYKKVSLRHNYFIYILSSFEQNFQNSTTRCLQRFQISLLLHFFFVLFVLVFNVSKGGGTDRLFLRSNPFLDLFIFTVHQHELPSLEEAGQEVQAGRNTEQGHKRENDSNGGEVHHCEHDAKEEDLENRVEMDLFLVHVLCVMGLGVLAGLLEEHEETVPELKSGQGRQTHEQEDTI
jgi:hypothetical protein